MTREEREYEKALKAYLLECEKNFRAEHGQDVTSFGAPLTLEAYKKFADEYINGEPWVSANTKKKNQVGVMKFIDFMEAEGLEEINPRSLLAYRRSLVGYNPNTVSQYMKRLNASFNWMVDMKLIKENPIPKSMLTQERYETAKPVLSKAELYSVLNAERPSRCRKDTFVRNRAIIVLMLTSAMREGELLDLTPEDLHWDAGSITIRAGKGNKARNVPFLPIAQNAVREYMKTERPKDAGDLDPLFAIPSSDGKGFKTLSRSAFCAMVSRYLREATGRDDLTAHSLRHSCATFLISDGMNAKNLQAILGHSSLVTTQRYAQLLAPDTAPIQEASNIFREILPTSVFKRQKAEEKKKRGRGRPRKAAEEYEVHTEPKRGVRQRKAEADVAPAK